MASIAGVCTVLKGLLPTYFNVENCITHDDDIRIATAIRRSMLRQIDEARGRGLKENAKGKKIDDKAKKEEDNKDIGQADKDDSKLTEEEKAKKTEEKQQEKQRKEDEKLRKEEERQKKLESKRLQEEEKARKMKEKQDEMLAKKRKDEMAAKKFGSFFQKQSPSAHTTPVVKVTSSDDKPLFLPFQLKPHQTLTPIVQSFVKERFLTPCFDSDINSQDELIGNLYLAQIKMGRVIPHRTGRKVRTNQDPDLDILEDGKKRYIGKLLQFHDNVRPAWFGTWSKKSNNVSARRPFIQDTDYLNYEVDSDEEWDEGGPGESLDGSDAEPEDPEDDYDIDNEFMVPHGYLSGSEDELMEGDGAGEDADKFREKEMLARKRLRVKPLKAVVIGPVWNRDRKACNEASLLPAHQVIRKFRVVFNCKPSPTNPSSSVKAC